MGETVQEENSEEPTFVETSGYSFKEFYPINPPFGFAGIQVDEETGKAQYILFEPTLDEEEQKLLESLKEILLNSTDMSLDLLKDEDKLEGYLREKMDKVFSKYKEEVPTESREKFIYYLLRDFLGYGKIDLLMKDPNIEDISCNGVDTPIYVYHRDYESLPSNVVYKSAKRLNFIVTRIAYKTGKQISIAHPILEGTLPEGYRAHITLDEVSKKGDTFTIRKFQANPYTIIDLVNFGTITPKMAAYFWILIEHLRSIMALGAVASGKTSLLNALCMFIRPEMKVVTIEEVRELRLHENWIPMTTRTSFQPGVREVTLFDLLKSALRQRPDYIIVGEVRGEEAYTLFQSIAVGHGGLCTAHADSVESIIKRLTSRPMDIPDNMLPLMNAFVQIRRMEINGQIERRVVNITEVQEVKPDGTLRMQDRFTWQGGNRFRYYKPQKGEKNVFNLISQRDHIPLKKLEEELKRRETIIKWMAKTGTTSYEEVTELVRDYYRTPNEVFNTALREMVG
ncbi:MAG: type II/IV secretion system ATPase subunit [Thermoproteota archaeon]